MALHPQLGAQNFDSLLQCLVYRKRKLAEQALGPMGDNSKDVEGLTEALAPSARGQHAAIAECMAEQFRRYSLPPRGPDDFGAYELN